MITLHQPPATWGLPNMSPFCAKLETYLRMAKIDYTTAPADIRKAPKGKVPYINFDGKLIGDSTLIIDSLHAKYGNRLDKNLTAEQKAIALSVQRLTEDHLYFAAAWLRWNTDNSVEYVRNAFLSVLPPIIGRLIFKLIRKGFLKSMYQQGMGRHTREEIIQFAKEDIKAISDLLGQKDFFFGAEPTSIDAMLFGFLIQAVWIPWESPVKDYAKSLPNIVPYCERMKARYWA